MSLQVFLQAQLLGARDFLTAERAVQGVPRLQSDPAAQADLTGRCAWLILFCEVLPRALLAELRLSRMLLGSSSAEQFLLVLTEEDIPRANDLLQRVSGALRELSGGSLQLIWTATENLGAWPVARKRLEEGLQAKISTPLAANGDPVQAFLPVTPTPERVSGDYFLHFGSGLSTASKVGWSSGRPAHLEWDEGQYTWPLQEQSGLNDDGILFPRRLALTDDAAPASLQEVAERAEGTPRWGILCGDVDQFAAHLQSVGTVEDHIHLSVLFKEFFAGELAVLCTLGEFWQKVSILYRGGDDFAVWGSWDGLLLLARELQRLFERFAEHNEQAFPGLDGKTISMALTVAPSLDAPVSTVLQEALTQLEQAKATEPGTFSVFGRAIEWKRLSDAEEVKTTLMRLVRDFGYAPEYINDLAAVYREAFSGSRPGRKKTIRVDKPWRTHMRLSRVIPQARTKEASNLRSAAIASLIGKRTAGLKLRPSARVGLEWARLAAGESI
jgi:CRISPR-associated protein Csm1